MTKIYLNNIIDIINNLELENNYAIKIKFYLNIDDLGNCKTINIRLISIYHDTEHTFSIMGILLAKFDILSKFIEDKVEELKYKDNLIIKGQQETYYD